MLVLSRVLGSSTYMGDDIEVILIDATRHACRVVITARGHETMVKWIKPDEYVNILEGIAIQVVQIRRDLVRIGFIAPPEVDILRDDANDMPPSDRLMVAA